MKRAAGAALPYLASLPRCAAVFGPSDLEPKLRKKAAGDLERDRSRAGQLGNVTVNWTSPYLQ